MFREMRRNGQALPREECEAVLSRATAGVLATLGDDDYPYALPLSFVYAGGRIYFHSATAGHKLDAIAKSPKVSFCVIDEDTIVPEKYTSFFRSVIAFGRARVLEDYAERAGALTLLVEKYAPDDVEGRLKQMDKSLAHTCLVEIEIEHITGKQAAGLVKGRG